MNILVVGGAASGKSRYAEQLACQLSSHRTYLATMKPEGTEAHERIARHRAQRHDLAFRTMECPDSLVTALPRTGKDPGVALLDDLGNLVANALFSPDGTMADAGTVRRRLVEEVFSLSQAFEHVVIVGNEVGSEGCSPYEGTRVWVDLMGALSCQIASKFDTVIEVVVGCPSIIKGRLP